MTTNRASADHKAMMAGVQRESRVVRNFLSSLEHRSEREQRPPPADIEREALTISQRLEEAVDLERLQLLQRREDLIGLSLEGDATDYGELEKQFIVVARNWGDRESISYGSWCKMGVPEETLRAAGIRATRRPTRSSVHQTT